MHVNVPCYLLIRSSEGEGKCHHTPFITAIQNPESEHLVSRKSLTLTCLRWREVAIVTCLCRTLVSGSVQHILDNATNFLPRHKVTVRSTETMDECQISYHSPIHPPTHPHPTSKAKTSIVHCAKTLQ